MNTIFELIIGVIMLPPVLLMYAFLCTTMWKFIVSDLRDIKERKKKQEDGGFDDE